MTTAPIDPSANRPIKPKDIGDERSISGVTIGVNSTAEIGLLVFFSDDIVFYC
jgi:hypothetical protein